MRLTKLLTSLPLALTLLACGAESEPDAGSHGAPFSTSLSGEGVHEAVTAEALEFLRPEVLLLLQAANVGADVQFFFDNRYHFDDCNFSAASQVVASEQADAVDNLGPAVDPATSDLAAINAFGRSLHALQDFYSHTNWVELGVSGLVDDSLNAFPTLSPYSVLSPSGVVVVQGLPPAGTALYRKQGAPYPQNAIVYVKLMGRPAFGLISGTVDYEPGNFCPPQIAMEHDELAKDRSTTPGRLAQHLQARELAVAQTRHEWCRLLTLTRATWGDAGDQRLFAWVADEAAASQCGEPTDLAVQVVGVELIGDDANIEVAFENAGLVDAYGTRVAIELGSGFSATGIASSAANCTLVSASRIDCYVGALASGTTGTIDVTATLQPDGAQQVDAAISAHVIDENAANDMDSLLLGAQPAPR